MSTFLCIGVPSQIIPQMNIFLFIGVPSQIIMYTYHCIGTTGGHRPWLHKSLHCHSFSEQGTRRCNRKLDWRNTLKWHSLKCSTFFSFFGDGVGGKGKILLSLKVPPINTSIIFFFNKVLNVHDPMIGMMGALSWVTSFMVWALATQGWMMYLATGLSSIGWYTCWLWCKDGRLLRKGFGDIISIIHLTILF